MTRAGVNDAIWAVSLALQCALVAAVWWRGVGRRLPVLAVTLTFYPLRAAGLFVLFHHLDRGAYAGLYNVLELADLVLQFAVAAEVSVQLVRGWGGLARVQAWVLALVPLVSVAGTAAMLRVLPVRTPLPPDRVQMFDAFVLVCVCVCAWVWPATKLLRVVMTGLAAYGAANVASMAGRAIAAAHRDARAFVTWPYVVVGTYAAVMVWWLVALRVDGPAAARDEAAAATI